MIYMSEEILVKYYVTFIDLQNQKSSENILDFFFFCVLESIFDGLCKI